MNKKDLQVIYEMLEKNKIPLIHGKYYMLRTEDGDVLVDKNENLHNEN